MTKKTISIVDDKFEVLSKYTGLNITGALQIGPYLYTINDVMHSIN